MTMAISKVVIVVVGALWCVSVLGNPVSVMHGDLCKKMNNRKYYLEADTHAIITATNVTLPVFPRIATQKTPFHRVHRRHRREGPQEIGLISEPRFRRNITTITLSSLASSNLIAPNTNFVKPREPTRILNPIQTPNLEEQTPAIPPSDPIEAEEEFTKSTPLILEDAEEAIESASDVTTSRNQPEKCGVEILTRPDCHLELTFEKVNLPSCSHDKSCRCDYLRLREPPYRGVGGLDICSMGDETPSTFTTQTKEVRMDFLYTRAYEDAFAVSITAKRNKYRIIGEVNNTVGYIKSPFFPELYPKEHWMEYELIASDDNGRVKITFLDFQLSPWSFVEIEDTNKTRLAVFNGNMFRPPVLVSTGSHLTFRFSGNGETARGFNLQYSFIDGRTTAIVPPITDCGGYVTNFGGTITMMNMSSDATRYTMFDCVWIVQPPQNYAFKSHLAIKVVQFDDMASATTLEVRQGVTSEDYLLETIDGGNNPKQAASQEHVVAVDTGFYVRLRGFFNKDSKLAIIYTTFSYLGSCYSMTDFMCMNHRCIPKMLRCDGFDHCGDNSDEPASCYLGAGGKGLTPEDAAWWYQHTPNYYFPQKTSFIGGPHGWSGVLLLTSLLIMVLLMIGLVSYMFRNSSHRMRLEARHGHGGHPSRGSLNDEVEVIDAAADDPPLYEPPPDYEEVIKVILSGNNLKLVRRPGGVTAWVPDKLADAHGNEEDRPKNDRPLRTRHASLDLEQGMEVVLWNSNDAGTPRNTNISSTASHVNESIASSNTRTSFGMGHVRRSSLPTAPTSEALQNNVQGHSVSVAPETIPEGPEILESRRPSILRHAHTLSSPQISIRSFRYDTSAVSTPGPSTPQLLRSSTKVRKSKKTSKKGGKRKKSSAIRKPDPPVVRDESAPPSYEDAMQQVQGDSSASTSVEINSSIDSANPVNETENVSIERKEIQEGEDLSPSDRVQAARQLFQKLSGGEKKPHQGHSEAHGSKYVAKRPAVQASRTKHQKGSSGGTISRGTVKARKAMLLKTQKLLKDCDCNGACSCAHFKTEGTAEDTSYKGGVKSKVQYYLTIEESNKKRECESSTEQLPTEESMVSQKPLETQPNKNSAAMKRRKLVRNQSAPATSRVRDLELDISFSQNEGAMVDSESSTSEDMERPLITPVSDSARPVYIVPIKEGKENIEKEIENSPSIQKRVKLYNELIKPETSPPRSPSPLHSPLQGINIRKVLKSDSVESLVENNDGGKIKRQNMTSVACETSIKPGLVKEATAKFITSLATDIRPKLCPQDSDDWNAVNDSPLPIRVPYLHLRNEVSSSPDISETEHLNLPPLRREEAESIELWDSISQGISEVEDSSTEESTNVTSSASSGAVPKKSVGEVKISLDKKAPKALINNECQSSQLKPNKGKSSGQFNIEDKGSLVIEKGNGKTSSNQKKKRPQSQGFVLEEINLGPTGRYNSSDEDSLPPSPRCRRNDKLNETFESDIDFESGSKTSPVESVPQVKETNIKKKIPIPCPRGSKSKQNQTDQISSSMTSPSAIENASLDNKISEGSSHGSLSSATNTRTVATGEPSTSSTSQSELKPTLSPQMERSGIVTINANKRLKWDYI